jgi:hypothetical protein
MATFLLILLYLFLAAALYMILGYLAVWRIYAVLGGMWSESIWKLSQETGIPHWHMKSYINFRAALAWPALIKTFPTVYFPFYLKKK